MIRIARLRLALASAPYTLLFAVLLTLVAAVLSGGACLNLAAQTTQPGTAPQQLELPPAAVGSPQQPVNESTLRQRKALQPTATEHEGIEVFHIDANGQPVRPAGSADSSPDRKSTHTESGGSNFTIQLKLEDLPGFKDKQAEPSRAADNPEWRAAFHTPAQTTNGIAIPEHYQQAPTPAEQPATDFSQGIDLADPNAPKTQDQPVSQDLKIDSQQLYQQLNQAAQTSAAPQSAKETSPRPTSGDGPRFSFESNSYDFGSIQEGDVVRYEIKFRNSGNAPLKLTSVKASCGCTAADWPRDEIKPGEQGTIHVKFNSAGRLGPQSKSITVTTNEPDGKPYQFHLKGEVFKGTPPAR